MPNGTLHLGTPLLLVDSQNNLTLKRASILQRNQANNMENTISIKDAYKAMYIYLKGLYEMTGYDDLAGFLGSMSFLEDGMPVDSAIWADWLDSVKAATNANINLELKK